MRICLLAVLCAMSIMMHGYAHEKIPAVKMDKIYTTPDKIWIDQAGIFHLNQEGNWDPVELVALDEVGMYVVAARYYQCPWCRVVSNTDKCINSRCSMFGR